MFDPAENVFFSPYFTYTGQLGILSGSEAESSPYWKYFWPKRQTISL